MTSNEPVCFTCGHAVAKEPFENRLPDGRPCPTCRDRLLDEMPPLLPSRPVEEEEEEVWGQDYAPVEVDDDDPIGA